MTLSKAEQVARLVRKAGIFRPRELDRVGIPRQYLRQAKGKIGHADSPEVHRWVVDYISQSIDKRNLFFHVAIKDKTDFSLRFACEVFIAGEEFTDWRTANFGDHARVHEAHSEVRAFPLRSPRHSGESLPIL